MTDFPRLIEHAFPLKQTSLDSVHEKNVRHGHISTLHIWPARRPLAACRAALIATLLPDPGTAEGRKELCEKIAGRVVKKIEKKKMPNGQTVERIKEETEGGILHWGRETENAETLEWFRQEIKKAYGGRAPKVLDPFAGGGAIPLEAMRLGCEATAVDINPVAWFIQKCTLEYPQKLAGQTRPLPEFILHDDTFMAEFFKKAKGYTAAQVKAAMKRLHKQLKAKRSAKVGEQEVFGFKGAEDELQADLAWHVRAWGQWVLDRARRELAQYYPTYADFEAIKKDHIPYEHQPMRVVPPKEDGTPDIDSLNADFTEDYLADKRNPRWIAKPTVAYLWARTVTCKNCRAVVPLLKTRWLCKKANKRVLLTMELNAEQTGVLFGVDANIPAKGGNAAQKREHDKRLGAGTTSRAGVKCPCCGAITTMEDVRLEGQSGRLGGVMTVAAVETPQGKEYRPVTDADREASTAAARALDAVYTDVPHGVPSEPTPAGGGRGAGRAFSVQGYGFMTWDQLFTPRQLLALGVFARQTRLSRREAAKLNYPDEWAVALQLYSACIISRTADYMAQLCVWESGAEEVKHVFMRWALPVTWDFAEANPLSPIDRFFAGGIKSAWRVLSNLFAGSWTDTCAPEIINRSAIIGADGQYDIVFTDPPYYDAIPYSDLMDFFYVWLRRIVGDANPDFLRSFDNPLSPKWDSDTKDGELIDDDSRHDGDYRTSKEVYEDGMYRAFRSAADRLRDTGHMVVVFANKSADAWETLAAAVIRAGFCVNGSWPIVTEMPGGLRNLGRASLASSVWLVCKKRPVTARPGWDNNVLEEMKANIAEKLRAFWDAGIRGPDFVWAATGPAMEAYSKHPVVRKANAPGEVMGVGEFLNHVRRMVVDYIVGQVLTGDKGADMAAADRLDEVSAYYLLHRHDFKMDDAPVGACILYATACGLSDTELDRTWDILTSTGKSAGSTPDEDDAEDSQEGNDDSDDGGGSGGGSKVKLKPWNQRKGKSMGYEAPEGKPVPLIDRIHRVMHLWKEGDVQKVDEFLDDHALRRNELFKRVVQSLIELSNNSERSILESISNHIGAKGEVKDRGPQLFNEND